jgi:transcriptional regulator with XRE-family HTH domain
LCNSKRWSTYCAAFVWGFLVFFVFFTFFVEIGRFALFLLDFVIFFTISLLTKLAFMCKVHTFGICFCVNINANAKDCKQKFSYLGKIMKDFNEKAIVERVKLLRKQYAGDRGKSRFARALGISASTYSYYESNRVPPIDVLLKMCEVTGADLEWLLTGSRGEAKFGFGPNSGLLRKLDGLLGKNPELSEAVLAFVQLLCEKKGVESEFRSKVAPPRRDRPGWIPVLGRTAAGMVHFWDQMVLPGPEQAITELDGLVKKHIGKTIINSADGKVAVDLRSWALLEGVKKLEANLIQVGGREDEEIVEFVECEQIHKLFRDSFALQIDGDSMSPRINDGDIVILSPSVPAGQGQIGIARIANQIGVTCKLIRSTDDTVHLIPINEKYETQVVAKKDLVWALAVLCHISV